MTPRRWPGVAGLLLVLAFALWWRCHTIGPTVESRLGLRLWPVVAGAAEPLDCDECIYGYIGKRIVRGDVLYRDLTENKPPLGYWIYSLAEAIGGATETTIRLMPVPMVLLTATLIWWIARRLSGSPSAFVAAFLYVLMSTDPFVYGNGANMEHFLNLFATAGLACLVAWWPGGPRRWLVLAGASLAAASLVKQVGAASLVVGLGAIAIRGRGRPTVILMDSLALLVGFAVPWLVSLGALVAQGAGPAALDDIVRYGGALATDTPPEPKEYPFLVRFVVGNTDPEGRLPWPFGRTLGRAWWAAGAWPSWGVSVPALLWAAISRGDARRRLVAAWAVSAWVQVAMPRLFWQHYYLLAVPPSALLVGIATGSAMRGSRVRFLVRWAGGGPEPGRSVAVLPGLAALVLVGSTIATTVIQVREYLCVSPEELTARDKGGAQWITQKRIGLETPAEDAGLGRGASLCLGVAKSPVFLLGPRLRHASRLRRPAPDRLRGDLSPPDPAEDRADRPRSGSPTARPRLPRPEAVPGAPDVPSARVSPIELARGAVGPARSVRFVREVIGEDAIT